MSTSTGLFASPAMAAASDVIQQSLVQQNTAETTVASSKVLLKILQNLLTSSQGDTGSRHRSLRLTNKTVARHVVSVKGALELLSLVGFEKDGQDYIYLKNKAAPGDATKEEMSLLSLGESQIDLIQGCCLELEQVVAELERGLAQVRKSAASTATSPVTKTSSDGHSSTTLSEADYKARLARIAEMKAAKKKQKEEAMRIWKENAEDRKEAEERKELAKRRQQAAAQDKEDMQAPLGVTIQKVKAQANDPTARLPKSFAPTKQEEYGKQQLLMAAAASKAKHAAEQAQQQASKKAPPKEHNPRPKSRLVPDDGDKYAVPRAASTKTNEMDMESTFLPPSEESEPFPIDDTSAGIVPSLTATPKHTSCSAIDEEWQQFVSRTPRCAPAEGVQKSSIYCKGPESDIEFNTSTKLSSKCLKRLLSELTALEKDLPSDPRASIWIRFDEESPQYLRVLMPAPLPGPTPYTGGIFTFDVYIPPTYPQDPPKVSLLTTGGGTVRFGPNLYACGKVCLSLLGTWPGPKWSPKHSTILQVLISIQGLILGVEHPYFLEPGHGGWEGTVKEGQYQVTGHTLSGATVKQEMGLPAEVVLYEDEIRVGTVKYAMIQALEASFNPSNTSYNWLRPFFDIIQAHFYRNQVDILTEVQSWTSDGVLGRNRSELAEKGVSALPIDSLEKSLLPKLEIQLGQVKIPQILKSPPATSTSGVASIPSADNDMVEMDMKMPAKRSNLASSSTFSQKRSELANKKVKMQAAAQSGDFTLAGQLQQELQRLQDIELAMRQAAESGDFIKAGNLQKQLIALSVDDQDAENESVEDEDTGVLGGNIHMDVQSGESDDEDIVDDESIDEEVDDDDGFNPPGLNNAQSMAAAMISGLGKNVFAPPGWMDKHGKVSHHHTWGGGKQLGNSAAPPAAAKAPPFVEEENEEPKKKRAIPRDRLCRLRIRLPNDKSIIEDFDMNETLSDVYNVLISLVEPQAQSNVGRQAAVPGPSPVIAGSFSQPLSSAGFTLLLPRPKREFSLEMHGTKTLDELNLAPSATLTVMKCKDRGVVYRGELEDRLHQAQGDAMDVEGLTYEGLVELTERVGGATPSTGIAFMSLTIEELNENSEMLSPADYLASLGDAREEDAIQCPVCLGDYVASDTTMSIRKLANCQHHFHTACLETWLSNKSSCPLCKTAVRSHD
jgi:ubiquitin-protein ligase